MKRFIALFILLFTITLTTKAEITYYRASEFTVNINNTWSDWIPSNVLISVDNTINRIVIYSSEKQIIDFVGFDSTTTSEYILLESQATDTNYKKIYIKIQIYDSNRIYFSIIYNNLQYIYQMHMVK